MKNIKIYVCLSILLVFAFFSMEQAFAQDGALHDSAPTSNNSGGGKTVELQNPLGDKNINELIGQIIQGVLGIVGSLALAMFIYGGFVWMTAAGNDQRVAKGKSILTWATIGLVVIFTSYAAVRFLLADVLGIRQ